MIGGGSNCKKEHNFAPINTQPLFIFIISTPFDTFLRKLEQSSNGGRDVLRRSPSAAHRRQLHGGGAVPMQPIRGRLSPTHRC